MGGDGGDGGVVNSLRHWYKTSLGAKAIYLKKVVCLVFGIIQLINNIYDNYLTLNHNIENR